MLEYVKNANLKFTGSRTKRTKTTMIVLHHRAGWGTVESEHKDSLARGWNGCGYNYYIRMDGTVWEGRGLEYVGAHAGRADGKTSTNNSQSIGIGFEGNYHPSSKIKVDKSMPKAQYDAGVRLIRDLMKIYPTIDIIKGHKDMPGCATSCPGDYFPTKKMIADGKAGGGAAPGGEYYAVQVGAYENLSNAKKALAKVQAAGFKDAYAIVKDTKAKTYTEGMPTKNQTGGKYIAIQLGAYTKKANAEDQRKKVQAAGFKDAYLLLKDTGKMTYKEVA